MASLLRARPPFLARHARALARRTGLCATGASLALTAPAGRARAQAAAQPTPAAAVGTALPLVPMPREAARRPAFGIGRGIAIVSGRDSADAFAARDLADALRERRIPVAAAPAQAGVVVRLLRRDTRDGAEALRRAGLVFDSAMAREGYALVAEPAGAGGRVDVVAASPAGLFYGAQTVKQLVDGSGRTARVLGAHIRDWPAMRWRGLHDDLSRGPVPTLAFQKRQIRTFAAYKLNAYSPYFEHTLAYARHPLIAPPGGAMTHDEVRELVAYARRYHVEVIPEQEAFGHLHHVLKWERYAALGETDHGHVLAPGQAGTLPFIRDMFAEVDSLFPGRFLHLGADETFELGRGQTADRVRAEGLGRVYLNFLRDVHQALAPLGRRLLFWGDVATGSPDLVPTLPRDLIAVAWEYDPHPSFDRYLTPFRAAGMETWVAPGVNNWNRVYPNYNTALANIRGFVRDGQRLGATGVLNTTWDDDGESLFAQTWLGVIYGAAASWQAGDSDPERVIDAYPRLFFGDTSGHVAAAERELRAAHDALTRGGAAEASDFLFWVDPWSVEGRVQAARVLPVARAVRLHAEAAIEHIVRARQAGATREPDALDAIELGARRADLIGLKFQFAEDVSRIYARAYALTRDSARAKQLKWYDLADASGINGRLQDLRDAYSETRALYEAAWRRENRPYWIGNVLARYDVATQRWVTRIEQMDAARRQWARTRTLPAPAELGIAAPLDTLRTAAAVR